MKAKEEFMNSDCENSKNTISDIKENLKIFQKEKEAIENFIEIFENSGKKWSFLFRIKNIKRIIFFFPSLFNNQWSFFH